MKKYQKGFIGVLVAIIIALILGSGGAYYYNKKQEVKESTKVEENQPNNQVTGPLDQGTSLAREATFSGYYTSFVSTNMDEEKHTCDAFVVLGGDKKIIDEYKQLVDEGNSVDRKDTSGNLLITLKLDQTDLISQNIIKNSNINNPVSVVLKEIVFGMPTDLPECGSFFNILSVNKNISDWKTYKNDQYGFQINYPADWNAGVPSVLSNDNSYKVVVFCPPELASSDPGIVCQLKDNSPHMPDSKAPIIYSIPGEQLQVSDANYSKYKSVFDKMKASIKYSQSNSDTSDLKRYDSGRGFEFMYPSKLDVTTASDGTVTLSHTIPFENVNGGCDLKGDGEKSQTLEDFHLSLKITSDNTKLPYVDGTYSKGTLDGERAYMGAEGCGNTIYHFPISNNRTLIVTKGEIQILSNVVDPKILNQVLAVPGVISNEEAKTIIDGILGSFKVF